MQSCDIVALFHRVQNQISEASIKKMGVNLVAMSKEDYVYRENVCRQKGFKTQTLWLIGQVFLLGTNFWYLHGLVVLMIFPKKFLLSVVLTSLCLSSYLIYISFQIHHAFVCKI